MDQEGLRELADQATVRLLNKPGTASSNRGGWMMIAVAAGEPVPGESA